MSVIEGGSRADDFVVGVLEPWKPGKRVVDSLAVGLGIISILTALGVLWTALKKDRALT